MKLSARVCLLGHRARRTAPTPPDEATEASFVRAVGVSFELSYAAESSIAVSSSFQQGSARYYPAPESRTLRHFRRFAQDYLCDGCDSDCYRSAGGAPSR